MSKARAWIFLGVGLVVGAVVGLGAMALIPKGEEDAPQIENAQLQVGDVAPDFRLPDHTGGYVRLSDYRDKSNVVISFYPAAFTPV
jgi:peroxiredoxin